jgi:hypothetical protein
MVNVFPEPVTPSKVWWAFPARIDFTSLAIAWAWSPCGRYSLLSWNSGTSPTWGRTRRDARPGVATSAGRLTVRWNPRTWEDDLLPGHQVNVSARNAFHVVAGTVTPLGPDGQPGAESGPVLLLPLHLAEVTEDGTALKPGTAKLRKSYPSPVFTDGTNDTPPTTLAVTSANLDADGKITATLNLDGDIKSALCDTLPNDGKDVPNAVEVWVNGGRDDGVPDAQFSVATGGTKAARPDRPFRPFDYTGTFTKTITVELTEGLNTVQLTTADRVHGFPGHATFLITVTLPEPPDEETPLPPGPIQVDPLPREPFEASDGGERYSYAAVLRSHPAVVTQGFALQLPGSTNKMEFRTVTTPDGTRHAVGHKAGAASSKATPAWIAASRTSLGSVSA